MRKAVWTVAGVLLVILLIGAGAWFARVPIAEWAIGRWCDSRDLTCRADIETLDLNSVTARNVRVTSEQGTPLEVEDVRAAWRWDGLLALSPTEVALDRLVIRLGFDGSDVSLFGLEQVIPDQREGDGRPLPAIAVTDGAVLVDTPAGTIEAALAVDMPSSDAGTLSLEAQPVTLTHEEDRLDIAAARLQFSLDGGTLDGEGRVAIAEARLGALTLDQADATLAFVDPEPTALNEAGAHRVTLEADLMRASAPWGGGTGLHLSGMATLDRSDGVDLSTILEAIKALNLSAEAETTRWRDISGSALSADVSLESTGGALKGPVVFGVTSVDADWGTVDALSFSGVADLNGQALPVETLSGALSVQSASLAPETRAQLVGRLPRFPGPFAAHRTALQRALENALSGFDARTAVALNRDGARHTITASDSARLEAASGAMIAIAAPRARPWLAFDNGGVTLRGRAEMAGGGLPDLSADLREVAVQGQRRSFMFDRLMLAPWRADGRSVAADLNPLTFSTSARGGADQATAQGTMRVSGDFGAVSVGTTTLEGTVEAQRLDHGWQVDAAPDRCIDLSSASMTSGRVRFGPFRTELCPADGRIHTPSPSRATGTFAVSPVTLSYQSQDAGGEAAGRGEIALGRGQIAWQWTDVLSAVATFPDLAASYRGTESTIDIGTDALRLETRLGGGANSPANGMTMSVQSGETVIGGNRLPAEVTIADVAFSMARSANRPGSRFTGNGTLGGMRLTAKGPDPMFQPLIAEQAIRIDGTTLVLDGPVTLEKSGAPFAQSTFWLTVPDLDGRGRIQTRALEFRPNGLQPSDISDRLRGLLTDATGSVRATADVVFADGEIGASARLALDAVSFQTVALGRVEGVNGSVDFDDCLAFTTPPGQQVSIESIDPGITLSDGTVAFQILGPNLLNIEAARWPFAGGHLSVAEGAWSLGGLENQLVIEAERLDMGALVDVFDLSGMSASGTLGGSFPLEFSGSDARIREAVLRADDAGGRLSYTGAAAEQAAATNETAALAFEALEDFQFTVLEMTADGSLNGEMMLGIRLLGANPDVLYGTPFAFNLNFDGPLVPILRSGQALLGTRWLADAIVQQQPEAPE